MVLMVWELPSPETLPNRSTKLSTLVTTGLQGLPGFAPGDDLAALLIEAIGAQGLQLQAGDVIVIAQKAISKAEGRYVSLAEVIPSAQALELAQTVQKDARLVELVLRESQAVVRAAPGVLIVRHRSGHVMANAGIDASNLPAADQADAAERVLLLPEDADASAMTLAAQLSERAGVEVAVVVSDSFGRPWRQGVTNVAIGVSGVAALFDKRNEEDLYGRTLQVTQVGVGDLLASTAGLVMGEGKEGVPAALVRGVAQVYLQPGNHNTASALLRSPREDLFR